MEHILWVRARTYSRYPLHEEWTEEQTEHALNFFEKVQLRDFKFVADGHKEYNVIVAQQQTIESIQKKKREHRVKLKKEWFKRWLQEDEEEMKVAMLNSISLEMPKEDWPKLVQYWPKLVQYWQSEKKLAETTRGLRNQLSKKKKAIPTQGSISMLNKHYLMKKSNAVEYTPPKGWLACITHRILLPFNTGLVCRDDQGYIYEFGNRTCNSITCSRFDQRRTSQRI